MAARRVPPPLTDEAVYPRRSMRRAALAAAAALALATPVLGATALRTAGPADDAPHAPTGRYTEWWYANAIDPRTGLAVAVSLGADAAGASPATVAFVYPPGGTAHTVIAPRLIGRSVGVSDAGGPLVRLGPDRFVQTAPGVWRVKVDLPQSLALYGGPAGPVRVDLTLRAITPGFVSGPLRYGDQVMSWTVAAPEARADGTVTAGGRTWRMRDAPAYHDHNFGPFGLTDAALAGWDWAQLHLPGGRSLALGLVKPRRPQERGGSMVLSGPHGRIATAPTDRFSVVYSGWSRAGGYWFPSRERVRARLSDGSTADVRLRGVRAAPLARGDTAIMEILARGDVVVRRGARVTLRAREVRGFYEYESTPLGRARDGAPTRVSDAAGGRAP